MSNNNSRNNNGRQQGQQPQQGQQAPKATPEEKVDQADATTDPAKGLILESADLDAPNSLGTLTAAPNPANVVDDGEAKPVVEGDAPTQPAVDGSQGEYVPPVQESTVQEPEVTQPINQGLPAPTPTEVPPSLQVAREEDSGEASLVEDPAKVLAGEMITEDGTAVTTIMLRRLEKHMKFVRGTLAFRDKQELFEEQVTWIDTVGASLTLDYPQYVLVTKAILAEILQDVNLFRDGGAYRFLQSIKGKYPANAIEGYEAYFTFLTRVATNWATRHRLRTSVDIAFPVSRLPTAKGKENLTKFFNTLVK